MQHYGVTRKLGTNKDRQPTFRIAALSGADASRIADALKYAAEYLLGMHRAYSRPDEELLAVARSYL